VHYRVILRDTQHAKESHVGHELALSSRPPAEAITKT